MPEPKQYKLYARADRITEIPKDIRFSYVPTTHEYLLVYTDKDMTSDGFVCIDDKTTPLLKEVEMWLNKCKGTVSAQYIQANRENIIDFMNAMLDNVEAQLKAEQVKNTEIREDTDNVKEQEKKTDRAD